MIVNRFFRALRYFTLLFLQKTNNIINNVYFKSYFSAKGDVTIIGRFHIYVAKSASMEVGNNFKLVSTHLINPLCSRPSSISVGDGAIVSIGDNVGMSSPTVWIRKSLIIGNNVNFGGGVLSYLILMLTR